MLVTTSGVAVLSAVLAGWALWFTAANRPVHMRQLVLAVVIEVAILLQGVSAGVALASGYQSERGLMFLGYVVVSLFVLPVAASWAFAERTRWSSLTLAVAAVAVLALQARVWQLWST